MEHRVESAVKINATAEKVWEILDDFGAVEKFSFGLQKSPIIGDKHSGLGAKRHCVFHDNSSVNEEIVEYQENKSFKVVLSEFSMPMESMYAGFKVEKISDTSCEVSMHMDFVVKFGPLGALMGMAMMRPMMKGVQKKMLSGLAYHAFTGKTIGSKLPPSAELAPALA
ncbi:SRPBCC family protein [Thalassomonas actiniarum]|uniref:SRPBCC family protein n=1 Tax=Thalassomonas actiniarum TaxID=485447 RepID=A0AAE9YR74_9GAMM|nr:SRPBCC family protein [Thalassomonas actiniarum]WDD98057.1 SRPBCC family protein [Thalassomonas actiniarum]